MSQALEQKLTYMPSNRAYQTIDIYTKGISRLYSDDLVGPGGMLPIDNNNMRGTGNEISNRYDLEDKFSLQERFDFSGHNDTNPHLNYEIVKDDSVQKRLNKLLGEDHKIDLFNKDDY